VYFGSMCGLPLKAAGVSYSKIYRLVPVRLFAGGTTSFECDLKGSHYNTARAKDAEAIEVSELYGVGNVSSLVNLSGLLYFGNTFLTAPRPST